MQEISGCYLTGMMTAGPGIDNIATGSSPHAPMHKVAHIRELDYQAGQRRYIIQSSRKHCRATFDTLMKQGRNTKTLLMGEGVTGGGKKLIEQSRSKDSYVMIGGYDLYMQTLASGVAFDQIVVIGSLGVLHDQMVRDIDFYAS